MTAKVTTFLFSLELPPFHMLANIGKASVRSTERRKTVKAKEVGGGVGWL
jgi:hypothetical protein